MGEQLRRREQSKIFRTFHGKSQTKDEEYKKDSHSSRVVAVLYSVDVAPLPLSGRQPFFGLHPARLEGMLDVQPPGDGGPPAVPLVRGAAIRHLHARHARYAGAGNMVRRDRHRAT